MNYFSHYYFDNKENKEFNFGLLFPDFVRNFLPKAKLFDHTQIVGDLNFANGVAKHFYRDHVFHSSKTFEKMQHAIRPLVKDAFKAMELNRYYFVVHVFSEMLIDRVLIKEKPELLNAMYADINNASNKTKTQFIEQNYNHLLADYIHRLNRFQTVEYIKQYLSNEALSYSVNRVCMYVRICDEWSINQTNAFLRIIDPCEKLIFENINSLKVEMTNETR